MRGDCRLPQPERSRGTGQRSFPQDGEEAAIETRSGSGRLATDWQFRLVWQAPHLTSCRSHPMEKGMTTNRTALVLGATGGIGGEVAKLLLTRGWNVRALHRNPDTLPAARKTPGLRWLRGDAMSAADVTRAASSVSVIVHAVNPPGYRNWAKLVLPMLDNTIAAAQANGARIVLPGTVYNFGPDALADLHEDSPQTPVTAKGKIRVEMERRLRAAVSGGCKVLIVRAGDFFGPNAANSWFSQALVKPGRPVSTITYPGAPGIGH